MSLFVGNISRQATENELLEIFGKFGPCKVDLKTSFAFVEYRSEAEAAAALEGLHGTLISGLCVNVEWSKKSLKLASVAPTSSSSSQSFPSHQWQQQQPLPQDPPSERGPVPSRTALKLMLHPQRHPHHHEATYAPPASAPRPAVLHHQYYEPPPPSARQSNARRSASRYPAPTPIEPYFSPPPSWSPPIRRHHHRSRHTSAAAAAGAVPYGIPIYEEEPPPYYDDYRRVMHDQRVLRYPPIHAPPAASARSSASIVQPSATMMSMMMGPPETAAPPPVVPPHHHHHPSEFHQDFQLRDATAGRSNGIRYGRYDDVEKRSADVRRNSPSPGRFGNNVGDSPQVVAKNET